MHGWIPLCSQARDAATEPCNAYECEKCAPFGLRATRRIKEADPVRLGERADAHTCERRGTCKFARQARLVRRVYRIDTRERLQR